MSATVEYIKIICSEGPYCPGDTITGTIQVAFNSDVRLRRIRGEVIGLEQVTPEENVLSAAVTQKLEFFKQTFTVWKADGAALIGQTLPVGVQEFPFTVQLSVESATQVLLEEYEYRLFALLEGQKITGGNTIASTSVKLRLQVASHVPRYLSVPPVDKRYTLVITPEDTTMTAANPLPFNVGYRLSLPSGRVHAGKDLIGSVTCLDTLDSLPKYTRELWQTKGHVKVELHQHREYTAFSYATSTVDIVASDTKPWYDLAIRTLGFRLSVPDYSPASTYGGKLIRVSYEIIVQLQIGDGAIIKCLVIMLASRASDSIGNK